MKKIVGGLLVIFFCIAPLPVSSAQSSVVKIVSSPHQNFTGAFRTSQAWGVGVAIVWSGLVAFAAFKIVDMTIGLRVAEDVERQGLDVSEHGETAYHI